jgi:hypothetical protein
MQILDPTDERAPVKRTLAVRPRTIDGTVALLDIAKPRGNVLIEQIERRLHERLPALRFRHYTKPTFTKPAPADLRRQIKKECGFVIEALAD